MQSSNQIKLDYTENLIVTVYPIEGNIVDLKVNSLLSLYKGIKEVNLKKELSSSISKGYITLRPFERVLVGTGVKITAIAPDKKFLVVTHPDIALSTGLSILTGSRVYTLDDIDKEIQVIMYNPSQFLCRVVIGQTIAHGVLM